MCEECCGIRGEKDWFCTAQLGIAVESRDSWRLFVAAVPAHLQESRRLMEATRSAARPATPNCIAPKDRARAWLEGLCIGPTTPQIDAAVAYVMTEGHGVADLQVYLWLECPATQDAEARNL